MSEKVKARRRMSKKMGTARESECDGGVRINLVLPCVSETECDCKAKEQSERKLVNLHTLLLGHGMSKVTFP